MSFLAGLLQGYLLLRRVPVTQRTRLFSYINFYKEFPCVLLYILQAGEDVVVVEGGAGKPNISSIFKQTPAQKEARRSKLQSELSEAEEALGPAQSELENFLREAETDVSHVQ